MKVILIYCFYVTYLQALSILFDIESKTLKF